jgi:hypothetical protein
MSRVVKIMGKVEVKNLELAEESIRESGISGIVVKNGVFQFEGYDYGDGYGKDSEIAKIEKIYQKKWNAHLENLAKIERERIEEEKRIYREEQLEKVMKNAEKQGYKLKKEVREDNTIKLVLERRVY